LKAGLLYFFFDLAANLVLKDKIFRTGFFCAVNSRDEAENTPCLVELFLSDQKKGCFGHKVNKNNG
jgi:hypothetical protein